MAAHAGGAGVTAGESRLYFAYGSNMSSGELCRVAYCPGARFAGTAELVGYRLTFDRWSKRRASWVADVVAAPGESTWGVLWEIPEDEWPRLDRKEGVASGVYERCLVQARCDDVVREAVSYRVRVPEGPGAPSAAYLQCLIDGAVEWGLPRRYIQQLREFAVPKTAR